MNRTMYGRTQLFMDISHVALDELADFQSPPKKQAVDSFTSDHIYTGRCHMIDRCMHTKHIPHSPLHFLYNLSPNVFTLLACQNPGPASVFPSLYFLSPGCPSSCWLSESHLHPLYENSERPACFSLMLLTSRFSISFHERLEDTESNSKCLNF